MTIQRLPLLQSLGLATLALAWSMPGHYVPWVAFQQQWMACCGLLLIALSLSVGDLRRWPIRSPWLAWLPLAMAPIPWIQWGVGQVRFASDALIPSLFLAGFAVSVVVGNTLDDARGNRWRDALALTLTWGALVASAAAIVQWLELGPVSYVNDLAPGGRPYANLSQPNHLATLLSMGLAGVLYGYETKRFTGTTTAIATVWFGFFLVMTQSRTAWLLVLISVIWWWTMRRRCSLRVTGVGVAVFVTLFVLAILGRESLNEALRLTLDDGAERMGHRDRLAIWAVLADAAGRSPWVGYGWNQVAHAQLIAAADHPAVGELFGNSHNIVLDLVLWMGIPLGLLVTLLVVLWFIGIARRCKNASDWTLMIAIGAISVHAMLEYPLDYSYFLVPLGLLMGTVHGHGEERPAVLQAQWLAAPVAALAGMMIWIGVEYIRVEEAARQLRFVLAGVGVDKVPYVAPPEVRLLDGPREFHRFWNTPARAAMPASDVDWMRDVVERNPERQAMLRYALAAGLNGRAADAASTLTALCKLRSSRLCSQSRQFWTEAQNLNPQLRNIPFP